MSEQVSDIRPLISRLRTSHFKVYLLNQGWVERPSRYADQLLFEGKMPDDDGSYELYLPATTDVSRYQTRLGRALYKLCGIEEREPIEVARDLMASSSIVERAETPTAVRKLRVENSGQTSLQVRIDHPERELALLPGEAIELACPVGGESLVIERKDESLILRTSGQV